MVSHYRCAYVSTTCRAHVAPAVKAPISPKPGRPIQRMRLSETRGCAVGASKAGNASPSSDIPILLAAGDPNMDRQRYCRGRRAGDPQSGHIPPAVEGQTGLYLNGRTVAHWISASFASNGGFDGKDSAERRRIHPVRTARYSRRTISKSSSAEVAAAWLSKVISPCCISTTRSQISNVCA